MSARVTAGFCYFCSRVGPREEFAPRKLREWLDADDGCIDHAACDGRVKARLAVRHFAEEMGRKTPPGVALVAVLVAAGAPVPCGAAKAAVGWLRLYEPDDAHAKAWDSDVGHVLRTGIVARNASAATFAPGPRFDIIAASVRASEAHTDAARAALVVVGFLAPAAPETFADRLNRSGARKAGAA